MRRDGIAIERRCLQGREPQTAQRQADHKQ